MPHSSEAVSESYGSLGKSSRLSWFSFWYIQLMSEGLHQARFEHDACGLGALVRLDGRPHTSSCGGPGGARQPRPPRGHRRRCRDRRRRRHHCSSMPDALLRSACRERARAASCRRPAPTRPDWCSFPATRPAPALRGAVRPHLRRGGAPRAGLARRARAAGSDRRAGAGVRARDPAADRRAAGGDEEAFERKLYVIRRRVGSGPACRRRPGGGVHDRQPVARRLVYKGLLRATQLGAFYPSCATPAIESGAGARPLPLLDQHAGHLGSRPPVQPPRPQRRDQHRSRQRQLAGRAGAAAAERAVRRRPAEAVPDRRGALVGFGQARCGGRAAGAGRPVAAPRAGDADPAGLDRPDARPGRRRARVPRVPRRPGRAVGRPGGGDRHRRQAGGGDPRPQRPAPGPLSCARRDGLVVLASEIGVLRSTRPRSSRPAGSSRGGCWPLDPSAGRVVDDGEVKRELAGPAALRGAGWPRTSCSWTTCRRQPVGADPAPTRSRGCRPRSATPPRSSSW